MILIRAFIANHGLPVNWQTTINIATSVTSQVNNQSQSELYHVSW